MDHDPLQTDPVIRAAVRLLGDEDSNVVQMCRYRLLKAGYVVQPELERAARSDDAQLRVRARGLLRTLQLRQWAERLEQLCRGWKPFEFDRPDWLESGLVAIANLGRPDTVSPAAIGAELADLADELRPLVQRRSALTAARRLAGLLSVEHGFSGCRQPYYDKENAFVDRVLERRTGLPQSLAALYILVGRRAGLRMSAVRLPDYFLVRLHGCRRVLLDPFHGGRTVTRTDCRRFLRDTGTWDPAVARLADVDDVDLLIGLLDSLVRIHDRRQDGEFRTAILRARRALSRRGWEANLA